VITVAITGATGFIGSTLLRHLADQGFHLRALYRPASATPPGQTDSVQWQAGDLGDKESLRRLVTDVDAVIHCAGTVRGSSPGHFDEANIAGVTRLAEVAVDLKVPRFLLISSLAAREPSLSDYALSKRMGEDALLKHQDKISCDILRPPAVYGPGDREMRPLLKMIKRGIVPVVGAKEGRFSLLHVDDLAEAVCCLLRSESTGKSRCFELHDGHPGGYTWQQISMIASHLNGKQPYSLRIPHSLLQMVALCNVCLARLLGYPAMLTPGKVREIFHPDWVCDNTTISKAIGWQPRILFNDGMKRLFP
jgi:nucleoside-diphosphate-sugar epimerase